MEGDVMIQPPLMIKAIAQKDNYTFTIDWSDGVCQDFRLSELQKRCPCAKCVDSASSIDKRNDEVRAVKIESIGRYALRIQFTSGCSTGIYSFALLRSLSQKDNEIVVTK